MDFEKNRAIIELANNLDNAIGSLLEEGKDDLAYTHAKDTKRIYEESNLGNIFKFDTMFPNAVSAISMKEEANED